MIKKALYSLVLILFSVNIKSQTTNFSMSNATQTVPCSGTYNFYDSGGSGGNYSNNENFTVTFYPATAGMCLSINFSSFNTESSFDFFRAYDGTSAAAPLIGSYSGNTIPPTITSSGGPITVVFISDGSVNYSGWAAIISCVACPPPPAYYLMSNTNVTLTCPPTFSLFYDSGGPSSDYSNSENLTKTFTAPPGSCLSFTFGSFSTESCCDRLRIYDGPNAASPLIGTFLGTSGPGVVTSSGSSLTFSFTSDGSVTDPGWTASLSCMPACTGTPNAGFASNSSFPCTTAGNTQLMATGLSIGCGITYQWQSGPSTTGPWTNVAGATTSTLNVPINASMFYRLVSTCGSNSVSTSVAAATGYSIACSLSSYTPSSVGYSFDTFVGTVLPTTDDVLFGSVTLFSFPFCFSGFQYNGGYPASNSSFVFDAVGCNPNIQTTTYAAAGVWTGYTIPNPAPVNGTSIPRNAILGPWHDTNPGVGGVMRYGVLGTAPNRRFVLSYENVPMFSCTSVLFTGQIKLFETSGDIEIHIGDKQLCTSWNNGRAVLGLHNYDGTIYVPPVNATAHNSPTQWTMTNTAFRFSTNCPANVTCNTVLPLGFKSIYGQNFKTVNKLWWETSDEKNVKEFIVLRSIDANIFSELGKVSAKNNPSKYVFEDVDFKSGIIHYYKVRAVMHDGSVKETSIYPIYSIEENVLITNVFPNPANDKINLTISGGAQAVCDFLIFDQFGKLIKSNSIKVKAGVSNVELDINDLQTGLYFVEVKTSDGAIVSKQKFSKQ